MLPYWMELPGEMFSQDGKLDTIFAPAASHGPTRINTIIDVYFSRILNYCTLHEIKLKKYFAPFDSCLCILPKIEKYIDSKNYVKVYEGTSPEINEEDYYHDLVAINNGSILIVEGNYVKGFFISDDDYNSFVEWCSTLSEENLNKAVIQVIQKESFGSSLCTRSLRLKSRPFIETNYSTTVLNSLKELRERIISKDCFGRLHLLYGEPGTGKTSFIYSLLEDHKKVKFILLPSIYITSLQGEDLLKLLLSERSDKPITLIIEDADQALEARSGSNHSAVSSLLNAVDGLLSDYLDLRVIATTNLHLDKIDRALSRRGRLGKSIEIPLLSKEEAIVTLNNLKSEGVYNLNKDSYTLAELYAMLNDSLEVVTSNIRENVVGFR